MLIFCVYTGTYTLKNQLGTPCIKATMGVEYIVIEKKVRGCDLLSNVSVCDYFSALFAQCVCLYQHLSVRCYTLVSTV